MGLTAHFGENAAAPPSRDGYASLSAPESSFEKEVKPSLSRTSPLPGSLTSGKTRLKKGTANEPNRPAVKMACRVAADCRRSNTTAPNAIKRTTEDWITARIIAVLPFSLSRSIGQGDLTPLQKALRRHCPI